MTERAVELTFWLEVSSSNALEMLCCATFLSGLHWLDFFFAIMSHKNQMFGNFPDTAGSKHAKEGKGAAGTTTIHVRSITSKQPTAVHVHTEDTIDALKQMAKGLVDLPTQGTPYTADMLYYT